MKFFDFSNFEYFALIGAETEEAAREHYIECVCDIEKDDKSEVIETSEEEVRAMLLNKNMPRAMNETDEQIIAYLKEAIDEKEPVIILIDGALV